MRSVSSVLRVVPAVAFLCAATAAIPASAYELDGEQVYADSFGNLVIHSPSGYKRIVVGQGHVAAEYEAQRRNSDVVYNDDRADEGYSRHCRIEPGIFHGRSYMYGLPDGVVPTPARKVCD